MQHAVVCAKCVSALHPNRIAALLATKYVVHGTLFGTLVCASGMLPQSCAHGRQVETDRPGVSRARGHITHIKEDESASVSMR